MPHSQPTTTSPLCYRAGTSALRHLRRDGFRWRDVRTLVFPATGPRWLATAGVDRALAQLRFWERTTNLRLLGSSAGAWRILAMAAREPHAVQAALLARYCAQHFTRADTPQQISDAYRRLLADVFLPADLQHAVRHEQLTLAIAVARLRFGASAATRLGLQMTLAAAALTNVSRRLGPTPLFERTLFVSGQSQNWPTPTSNARLLRLDEQNVNAVALATGTVPLYMQAVHDIPGAPHSAYIDGGITDYHFNRPWPASAEDGLVVLVSHQRRVIPGWFDKLLPWRTSASLADQLIVVHPDERYVASLPGGHVPSRDDFATFLAAPQERMRRWHSAAAESERLGDALLADIDSGAIATRATPL